VAPALRQDAHRPSDDWLRTPRRARPASQYSVTSVLFLRTDHVLATAGTPRITRAATLPERCPAPDAAPAMAQPSYALILWTP